MESALDTIFAPSLPVRAGAAMAVIRVSGPGVRRAAAGRCLARSRRRGGYAAAPARCGRRDPRPRRWRCSSCPGPAASPARIMAELHVHGGPGGHRRPCSARSPPCPVAAWPSPASSPAAPSSTAARPRRGRGPRRPRSSRDRGAAPPGAAAARRRARQAVEDWRTRAARARALARGRASTSPTRAMCPPIASERGAGGRVGRGRRRSRRLSPCAAGERLREGFTVVLAGPPNVGQVEPAQRARAARRGDRLAASGHDPRR